MSVGVINFPAMDWEQGVTNNHDAWCSVLTNPEGTQTRLIDNINVVNDSGHSNRRTLLSGGGVFDLD